MEAKEVIDDIRAALKPLKEQNKTVISVEALENYLSALEADAKSSDHKLNRDQNLTLTNFKAENDRWIKEYEIQNSHALEMFRSVIASGQSALKASMLINGGAVIALLAFIGNTVKSPPMGNIQDLLAAPMWLFCLGILCSAVASGATYLTQFLYSADWMKTGYVFQILSILIVLASYVLFGVAAYDTTKSF